MPFDYSINAGTLGAATAPQETPHWRRRVFWASKRAFDIGMSLVLLVLVAFISVLLLILNRYHNRGPLFFVQERMGRNCQPFKAIKFRTMTKASGTKRGANDPLEKDRITPLGHVLRKTRIDELPQVINVLIGQMSLIGPRPDELAQAEDYIQKIARYRDRHQVRPGISGLAQVTLGYAAGYVQTRAKTNVDMIYIRDAGLLMEARVFWLTIVTVVLRRGV